jgi:hypothetical protein
MYLINISKAGLIFCILLGYKLYLFLFAEGTECMLVCMVTGEPGSARYDMNKISAISIFLNKVVWSISRYNYHVLPLPPTPKILR